MKNTTRINVVCRSFRTTIPKTLARQYGLTDKSLALWKPTAEGLLLCSVSDAIKGTKYVVHDTPEDQSPQVLTKEEVLERINKMKYRQNDEMAVKIDRLVEKGLTNMKRKLL